MILQIDSLDQKRHLKTGSVISECGCVSTNLPYMHCQRPKGKERMQAIYFFFNLVSSKGGTRLASVIQLHIKDMKN